MIGYALALVAGFIVGLLLITVAEWWHAKRQGCPNCGNEWINFVGHPGAWKKCCVRCGWKEAA